MSEQSSAQTERQRTSRDRIVESGVADRMLASLKEHKGTNDPEITFGVDDCDFRVEVHKDPNTDEEHTQVVIEMPNLHPENRKKQPRVTQAFGVREDQSFGAAGEKPLTQEQFQLVQELASQSGQ